ncbi:unnamed protein product [Mytilus coruscus]|uniref:Uncharacterized protein n=1 Tax=Mytilus coruscus TaxID=42192 RepID=A0A6J7ZU06_MYTCO|nr:unnamed protein product [Mytilus coruscus]
MQSDFFTKKSNSRENECTDINGTTTEYPNTWCNRGRNVPPSNEYPVRRTFSGARNDVWNEFIQCFENISELNVWNNEKSRRVLLSTLRGQAEAYAYEMPEECLRVGEKDLAREGKPAQRPIYEVGDGNSDADVTAETEGTIRENVDRSKVPQNYPRNNGIGFQGRFYNRDRWRERDRSPMFKNRPPEFPEPRRGP